MLCLTGLAAAQPRIGVIDFYGLHKVTPAQIRKTLGVKEGDPLPHSKGAAEERLDKIPGVVESHLEAVCCDKDKVTLYVGIEERGAPHFELRDDPVGEERLPADIVAAYNRLLDALQVAARGGVTAEDLTKGYSRSADIDARAIEDGLHVIVDADLASLRTVIRNSDDEQQRAMAASLLPYATDQKSIVNDLQSALTDADAGVRANAVKSLVGLSVKARLDPSSGIRVEPTWFIEMLNSLSWSDRTRALGALQILTDSRDPRILNEIRTRAVSSLADMARWKNLAHALPAYILLGRVAGLPEQQIQDSWSKGDREMLIAMALKKK